MYKALLTILFIVTIPTLAQANDIEIGATLPAVTVTNKGELVLNNDSISYQFWHSTKLEGKTRIIMAIAGRSSAKKINAKLVIALLALSAFHNNNIKQQPSSTKMMQFENN
ncbi:YtfJ family protein [Photobacterium kishitanii]|uniref:YtfJ family protein n=1 Tax=Photobacterium kishitanii TaxID=318456 RepID=UPI003F74BB6F